MLYTFCKVQATAILLSNKCLILHTMRVRVKIRNSVADFYAASFWCQ